MSIVESISRIRRKWWLLALVPVLLLTPLALMWLMRSPEEPGLRTRLIFPRGTRPPGMVLGVRLELTPALQADGVNLKLGSAMRCTDVIIIFCRDYCKQDLSVTAGPRPLHTCDLHYTLFDVTGNEIGSGALLPDQALEANAQGEFTIGDFALERAAKIVISK